MRRLVPSDPHLLRPIGRALLAGVAILCALAALVPAPLELAADPARPPNPARSAWFLLWIQELVSWDTLAVHATVALAALLVSLPWLPIARVERTGWLQRSHRGVAAGSLVVLSAVLALTAVALFLRGADWCLVSPW